MLVRQRPQALFDQLEVTLNIVLVTAEAQLESIFKDDRQQFGRRLAAVNRALEAGSEKVGNPPHMVDMHMRDDERLDGGVGELDSRLPCPGAPARRGFAALKQAAIDQQTALGIHMHLMAGTGDTVMGAVVFDGWVAHG